MAGFQVGKYHQRVEAVNLRRDMAEDREVGWGWAGLDQNV
jgi:hypothetical protein